MLDLLSGTENFIQPFSGSLIFLNRPEFKIETVNDPEGYIPNFLRSFKYDLDGLIDAKPTSQSKLDLSDPFYYNVSVAKLWLSKISNLDLNKPNITTIYNRLKRVRVCSGNWKRLTTNAITFKNKGLTINGLTTILLDPFNRLNSSDIFEDQSRHYNDASMIKPDTNLKIVLLTKNSIIVK